MMISIIRNLAQVSSEFNRSIARLFSASVLVAVIVSISMPIVSRLYTPKILGDLQIFASIVVILAGVSSFKYEMAIILPKSKWQAYSLLLVSILCLVVFTALCMVVSLLFGEAIIIYFNAWDLRPIMCLLPFAIFLAGLIQILQCYQISYKDYGRIARYRVYEPFIYQILIILAGVLKPSIYGLLIALFISQLVISILIVRSINWVSVKKTYRLMPKLAMRYIKFPAVSTLNTLLNTVALQLPVFVLAKNYSVEMVGMYVFALRILDMPLRMVTGSIGQVYAKYGAEDYHRGAFFLRKRYVDLQKKLLLVGLIFVLGSVVFAIFFAEWFLGEQWIGISEFMLLLIICKFFQLLNVPLSSTFMIVSRQEIGTILIGIFLVFRYLSLIAVDDNILQTLLFYSAVTALFYFLYNVMMYKSIR